MPPRKRKKTAGPTPVEAITHSDKRKNIPTADAHDFVAPETEPPVPLRYPRDPNLDPQLVWKGKDEQGGEDLVADAPAIYIQEKIDPRVLVENLRQTAEYLGDEPEMTLFDTFDGLAELELVEFYRHDANWSNRMILGDSLNVMASLAERESLRGQVQVIYIDPPYGIKFGSNWQPSARKREVKDGKLEDATREVEQIKAFRDTWELGIHSYLSYMRDRLIVARDLLTASGSVFVQIGDENVHLVRALMDEVFGDENFVSLISFVTTGGQTRKGLASVTDYVLWYAKDVEQAKIRRLVVPQGRKALAPTISWHLEDVDGELRRLQRHEVANPDSLPENSRLLWLADLLSRSGGPSSRFPVNFDGETFVPTRGGWRTGEQGFERLRWARRLAIKGKTLLFRRYLDDYPFTELNALWLDTQMGGFAAKDKVYVVQTHTKVVERCVLMASDPGDLVLDPTCGSGTTAYVAEQWGRRWITIDTSRVALALARQRLMGARFPFYLLADSVEGRLKESEVSGSALPDAVVANDIRQGFVYERAPHITLKSIANNPDVKDGMSPEELDAAVRRHADFEILYDKPYEDSGKVRVSGPFTVESLSPHRSLAFAGSAVDGAGAVNKESVETASDGDSSFEQTIIANLRTAGIQNGRKGERLMFDSVEPYAAAYIQAVGERVDAEAGSPQKVGITIGPQYGTVGPSFIKEAAREANRSPDLDLLCVLAFAFDPAVLGTGDEYITSEEGFANVAGERSLGRVPVLLVRMNADLVMGEELKKTGAGNLFTVFGEPDILIKEENNELTVVLHGVDVYDPNTGELRSNDTSQVALWMIDTAYNGESFFVRHCYFTGGQDPYKRLKQSLKAEIDAGAWASLYSTESRPFPKPETGRIAVKVINDYGDEVVKVFDVS